MAEPKIGEMIEIQSGYTSYVDLRLELLDDSRNIGRMARYRPITSHRRAFQMLTRALNVKDERCYLLTGSYGTGKSHLSLMFANYLQTPAGEKPMPEFFQNYAEVDPAEADVLRNKRASGRHLIALCQWGGKEDFDEVVLRAVNEALVREGFDEDFDTHYLQALKKLSAWESLPDRRFYDEFERELQERSPGVTLSAFKKRLHEFDYEALQEFRHLHQTVTTAPFTYDRSTLLEILTSTLASQKFKARYRGLLVLFDEFGDTMERGRLNPTAFQQLAQLCAETPVNCASLIFVGTAHRALTAYAAPYNAADFRKVSDRVKEVPLTQDGVEEIIAAIVVPRKSGTLWQQHVASRADTFNTFLQDCTRLKLFTWLGAPQIRTAIIENIYPMHPMATYALLRLSQDVASNNRSVYTFFAGDVGGGFSFGSFGDFIGREPILCGNKLNLYTADRLCDYFADTLRGDNEELRQSVRETIRDYENSVRTLNQVAAADFSAQAQFKEDPLVSRLLRLMLIYEIVGILNRADNLRFGLYCHTQAEQDALSNRIAALVARGILYNVKETGVYQFKKSNAVDLDSLVDEYKRNSDHHPHNVVAELNELVPLAAADRYLPANDYNLSFSEDKRLDRRFVRAADLDTEKDVPGGGKRGFFEILDGEIAEQIAKRGDYEGVALYVVAETTDDIAKARGLCGKNRSDRIVVAIPKQPVPLLDAILDLRGLLQIEKSEEKKNFTIQDNAALASRLNGDQSRPGARVALRKLRDKLLDSKEVTWHGRHAAPIPTNATKPYDVANRVMELLYGQKRNQFPHDDFNKLHGKGDLSRNVALKEAVEALLQYTEPVVIDTSFAQARGSIRYLQKCLLSQGGLRQIKQEGTRLRCEFEGDPSVFEDQLPTLAAMVREVMELPADGKIRFVEWAHKYRSPPYGQGPISLAISLACLRRLFGDSVRFKIDSGALGDMPVTSLEDVVSLIEGRRANAFLSYRPLTPSEKAVTKLIHDLFGSPGSAADLEITVVEAHSALRTWWDSLPPLAHVSHLYPAGEYPQTAEFIEVMGRISGRDAHAFLFEELPTAFGVDAGLAVMDFTVDTLKQHLPSQREAVQQALDKIQERILDAVRQLFGVKQSTYSDILEGIRAWYNGLDSHQRDLSAPWQTRDSKPLLTHAKTITDLVEVFMERIPGSVDYGLRPVRDWMTDQVDSYVRRLARGKEKIDENRIKVESAKVSLEGNYDWPDGGRVTFLDEVNLVFDAPIPGVRIYLAEGNNDPTDPAAAREPYTWGSPLVVRENRTIRYAVQDSEGNWSQVQTIELANANKKYVPTVRKNVLGERTATFNFPEDEATLRVTCREFFRQTLGLNIVTPEQLEACVHLAVKEATQGVGGGVDGSGES